MKPQSFEGALKGPNPVVSWLDVNHRRGASPCVIRRKFGYIVTQHARLANSESLLHEASALPEAERHPDAIKNLTVRVANHRKWIDHSIATLENVIRFAIARISPKTPDGELLRKERPGAYERGLVNKKWWDTIRYYSAVVGEYKLAKEAVAGHSGSNGALKQLMVHSKQVMATWRRKSGREESDAAQEALLGLMHAAREFDPGHGGLARFNTYASPKVRRRTQVRAARDCKPGTTLVKDPVTKKRKQVARGSLDITDDSENHVDRFHPVSYGDDAGLVMDVRTALNCLTEEEQSLIKRRMINKESIKALAAVFGTSQRSLRKRIDAIKKRLAGELSGYDESED